MSRENNISYDLSIKLVGGQLLNIQRELIDVNNIKNILGLL